MPSYNLNNLEATSGTAELLLTHSEEEIISHLKLLCFQTVSKLLTHSCISIDKQFFQIKLCQFVSPTPKHLLFAYFNQLKILNKSAVFYAVIMNVKIKHFCSSFILTKLW